MLFTVLSVIAYEQKSVKQETKTFITRNMVAFRIGIQNSAVKSIGKIEMGKSNYN